MANGNRSPLVPNPIRKQPAGRESGKEIHEPPNWRKADLGGHSEPGAHRWQTGGQSCGEEGQVGETGCRRTGGQQNRNCSGAVEAFRWGDSEGSDGRNGMAGAFGTRVPFGNLAQENGPEGRILQT
jgi:hypothetical protein